MAPCFRHSTSFSMIPVTSEAPRRHHTLTYADTKNPPSLSPPHPRLRCWCLISASSLRFFVLDGIVFNHLNSSSSPPTSRILCERVRASASEWKRVRVRVCVSTHHTHALAHTHIRTGSLLHTHIHTHTFFLTAGRSRRSSSRRPRPFLTLRRAGVSLPLCLAVSLTDSLCLLVRFPRFLSSRFTHPSASVSSFNDFRRQVILIT